MNPFEYITILPNFIPDHIIDLILNSQKSTSPALVGTSDSQQPNLDYRVTNWIELPHEIISNLMKTIYQIYNENLIEKYKHPITNIEPTQLLHYPVGGNYKAHNDSESFINNVLQRVSPRDLTVLCYLSDPTTYDGGELEFTNFGIYLRPKKGSILVFPSYYEFEHQVHPVTKGERYALVTWLETTNRIYERPYGK